MNGDGRPSVGREIEWDAGEMGCGELLIHLKLRMAPLEPGAVMRLTARDPGAIEDIPAWCRQTGHALLDAAPPLYRIRRRED